MPDWWMPFCFGLAIGTFFGGVILPRIYDKLGM